MLSRFPPRPTDRSPEAICSIIEGTRCYVPIAYLPRVLGISYASIYDYIVRQARSSPEIVIRRRGVLWGNLSMLASWHGLADAAPLATAPLRVIVPALSRHV